MTSMGIFSAAYCNAESLVDRLARSNSLTVISDADVVHRGSKTSGLSETALRKAFSGRSSLFNRFTFEKERSIAFLRHALCEMLSDPPFIIHGFCAHLLPMSVSHILRVCLIGDRGFRAKLAASLEGVKEEDALRLVRQDDEDRSFWVESLFGVPDPWEPPLYDMVLPMDKMTEDAALKEIEHNLNKDVLKPTERSLAAMEDFRLSSRISAALAQEGHHVGVSVSSGVATLTTNRPVLLLERLEAELKRITEKLEGVRSVSFRVEKAQAEMDFYRKFDPASPSKILLVDDEREFAQSLSERLIMREMGSVVAYDGASALSMVEAEEPEVMILDLRMLGIDGIEVLKRIKKERPDIEVIILTGHGTEADRMLCMELGAFAYLQKPVEIEFLSETLRKANEKARSKHA